MTELVYPLRWACRGKYRGKGDRGIMLHQVRVTKCM